MIKKRKMYEERDITNKFLAEVKPIPLLKKEEELALFTEYKVVKDTDKDRADILKEKAIRSNLRLVIHIAKKYNNRGMELIDLIQEGSIGLQLAVDRFEVDRGFKFGTYATYWIFKKISQAIHQQTGLFYVPHEAQKKLNSFKAAYNAYVLTNDSTFDTLLDEHMKKEDIKRSEELYRTTQKPHSLHDMIKEKNSTFENVLLDDSEIIMEEDATLKHDVSLILNKLTKEEKEVIEYSFGMHNGQEMTNFDISKLMNVKYGKVASIKRTAMQKLRDMLQCSIYEDEYSDEFIEYED